MGRTAKIIERCSIAKKIIQKDGAPLIMAER